MRCTYAVACLLATATLSAQRREPVESLRDDAAVRAAFTDVVADVNAATATLHVGDETRALGLVVSKGGLIVTKASQLGLGDVVAVIGGAGYQATRVGEDDGEDLVVLDVDAENLVPARWAKDAPQRGAWLATPDGLGTPAAVGILSSAPYVHTRAYLGVFAVTDSSPPKLRLVQEDSAAAEAGLVADDEILAIDGVAITIWPDLTRAIKAHAPGTEVKLRVRRGETELDVTARLRRNRKGEESDQERIWGPLSEIRAGFQTVLQHDTVLRPNQCGGPVVDLDGAVIGLNIARAGRVETLALPAETVRRVVERVMLANRAATAPD